MKMKNISALEKNVIIPAGSRLEILEIIDGAKTPSLRRIAIGNDCLIDWVVLIKSEGKKVFKHRRQLTIGDRSQVKSFQLILANGGAELNLNNKINSLATFDNQVLFYQHQNNKLKVQDNYTFSGHSSSGRYAVYGVAADGAQVSYRSDLAIKAGARKIATRIDLKLYLLDKTARGSLLPGLKIAANDVKAGHSASTFHFSADDLFYLKSRGLNEKQIKDLLLNSLADGFLNGLVSEKTRRLMAMELKKYLKNFNLP